MGSEGLLDDHLINSRIAQIMGVEIHVVGGMMLDPPLYTEDEELMRELLAKLRTEINFQDFVTYYPNPRDPEGKFEIEIVMDDDERDDSSTINEKANILPKAVALAVIAANNMKLLNRVAEEDEDAGPEGGFEIPTTEV